MDTSKARELLVMARGGKTLSEYTPGERIAKMLSNMRPSQAIEKAFEYGFYNKDYIVSPKEIIWPEMEEIRQSAGIRWHGGIVSFDEIVEWTSSGALDLLTGKPLMIDSPLDRQRRARLLIDDDVFTEHL